MRVLMYSVTTAWLISLYPASAQTPPIDQGAIFPDSDDAMARALADPKIPFELKQELFAVLVQYPIRSKDFAEAAARSIVAVAQAAGRSKR
jgi:hypothetical protein